MSHNKDSPPPPADTAGIVIWEIGSGGYPLFRAMAKELIQKLLHVPYKEARDVRCQLIALSDTLRGWTIQSPPPASEKHRVINEMIATILKAKELVK